MNVAYAFSIVNYKRLIHNLRKKNVLIWIINWTIFFVNRKNITLSFINHIMKKHAIDTKLSQKPLMSFIFYLFFNVNLLKMTNRLNVWITTINFINDINLLTYDKSTEANCAALKKMHDVCVQWAKRHDTVFASEKYELIYLSCKTKRFNMTAMIFFIFFIWSLLACSLRLWRGIYILGSLNTPFECK